MEPSAPTEDEFYNDKLLSETETKLTTYDEVPTEQTVIQPSQVKLSPYSFMVGILIGVIIIMIIVFFFYLFNSLLFGSTPSTNFCTNTDYYNSPSDALVNSSYNASDILYEKDGILYYKRVPVKGASCVPGNNQIVAVDFPQYCIFERDTSELSGQPLSTGIGIVENKSEIGGQATYDVSDWKGKVTTGKDCTPINGAYYGRPLVRWNPFI